MLSPQYRFFLNCQFITKNPVTASDIKMFNHHLILFLMYTASGLTSKNIMGTSINFFFSAVV